MNPDQNPDQNQYPVDYLNQIAAQPTTPTMSKGIVFGLIGGVILLVIIAFFIMSNLGGNGPTQKMQKLAVSLQTLQEVSDKSQKNIKSGDLRSLNSNLTVYLTNTNRDIAAPLMKNGVDIKKLDKNLVAKEKTAKEALLKKLDDARLNAVFDRTYAREMTYQLDTVAALMQDIYSSSNSKTLKDFLGTTDDNLRPLKQQLSEFNAANG